MVSWLCRPLQQEYELHCCKPQKHLESSPRQWHRNIGRRERTTQRTPPRVTEFFRWLGRFSIQKQEFAPSEAFQVGKLLSNSMPLYGLAVVCTPQLKKYMLLRAILSPIPKQTPFQEHRRTDRCQPVIRHSSFQQAMTQTHQKTKESQSVPGWLCGWL